MKNKIFGLMTAAALSMIVAGGLWAQGMGVTGWASPQSAATQGRIRSAADDFIRPDSYTSARINSWFAMTSFQSANTGHLGFGKTLGKAYIGAYYGGTFWANLTPFNYTEREVSWDGDAKTVPVYDGLNFTTTKPSNRIAILIGAADMGFRLSFFSSHESFNKKDIRDSTALGGTGLNYKSYKQDLGSLRPQLAWSMTKNLTDKGIKPYVTVDLDFQRDYLEFEAVGRDGLEIDRSANIVQPIFQAGLGSYTFYSKEAFRLSADLEYRLTLNIYSNQYSYLDNGSFKTEKIKGLNAPITADRTVALTENSYIDNWIAPYLVAQWGDGPIALRLRLQLPVTITGTKETQMQHIGDELKKYGDYTDTTAFGFNPSLQLGLQWRPIAKLALNAGGFIGLNNIGVSTVKSGEYENGEEKDNAFEKAVNKTIPTSTIVRLTLGASFNPTDNLFFEAVCGATTGSSSIATNNRISIFDTDNGLLSFGSILVGLKF